MTITFNIDWTGVIIVALAVLSASIIWIAIALWRQAITTAELHRAALNTPPTHQQACDHIKAAADMHAGAGLILMILGIVQLALVILLTVLTMQAAQHG